MSRSSFAALLFLAPILCAQTPDAGRASFESRCSRCHGSDARGGEMGPSIVGRLPSHNDKDLTALIHDGLPNRGMPPNPAPDPEMTSLVAYLRRIQTRPGAPVERRKVQTTDGRALEGQVLGEGFADLQLRTDDQHIHLLRRSGERFREVTSDTDWPAYNGDPRGNRYTTMKQIDKS